MSNDSSEPCFEFVLSRVESQLEEPVVPGELIAWLQETEQVLSGFFPVLSARIDHRHRTLAEEIAEQDPGLLSRMEQFKSEDEKILAAVERQLKFVAPMVELGDKMEPDEGRFAHVVERISSDGLKLVIRIRKQEAALNAWLMEAFDRDRGVAD